MMTKLATILTPVVAIAKVSIVRRRSGAAMQQGKVYACSSKACANHRRYHRSFLGCAPVGVQQFRERLDFRWELGHRGIRRHYQRGQRIAPPAKDEEHRVDPERQP